MKITAASFIVFLMFLFVPSNNAMACGHSSKKITTEKSCSKSDKASSTKSCCDKKHSSNKGCGGACGKGSCKCPVSLTIAAVFFTFDFQIEQNSTVSEAVLEHRQNNPKPVYISSWQPPNIS